MLCPLCRSASDFAFLAKGYRLLDCQKCRHRFAEIAADEAHASSVYDDHYFNGGGAGYADYLAESAMLRRRGTEYAKILSPHTAPGRVLDIGAAAGFILQGFQDAGWQGTGLEPNASMVEYGKANLHLDLRQGSLETYQSEQPYDLVSVIQVAAHFYSPKTAFENARDLLARDGLLLVETWNRESILARLFGKHWHEYSPPSVLHWYSMHGLTDFLAALGLRKIAHGRPRKTISGEHAKSLLRYRLGDRAFLKLIPSKIQFPYPSEDLFWALYRKQ